MGKRELLLVVVFLAVGVVVYHATAPPPGPNERGFSVGTLLDSIRREIRGRHANAELVDTVRHPVDPDLAELRLSGAYSEVVIAGEDRADIETTLRVRSSGTDEAEAKALATKTIGNFRSDLAGAAIGFRITEYPREGTQRAYLQMKIPSRIRVRIDTTPSRATISDVAALEFASSRGETSIRHVGGRVSVTHRAGKIVIEDVGSLKFTGRSSDAIVSRVRGESSFVLEAGGELNATDLAGPLEAEGRSAELTFDKLEKTRGPIRVSAIGGSVVMRGLAADAHVDGRNSEIELVMAAPVAIAVYSEGDDGISIAPPPGGFDLDALATQGRISLPDEIKAALKIEGSGGGHEETRATGQVKGGGPTLTLRSTRGTITILRPDTKKAER